MEAATAVPQQVEKYVVKNNTAGYVGVVVLNHKGEEVGENIEPHGTRYMSEQEMILTARAPRRPEDNPFEEQTFIGLDPETQARAEFKMRPLTVESDGRSVPFNDRYVPTPDAPEGAGPAAKQEEATAPTAAPAPPSSGSASPTVTAPPPPPQSPPVAPVAQPPQEGGLSGLQAPAGGEEEPESWVEPPQAPGKVLGGALRGSDEPGPEAAKAAPDQTPTAPPVAGQAQSAPQTPGASEEHAAAVDPAIGEETGAAQPPAQRQPEGEYAHAEEVGSPEAPSRSPEDEPLIGE